MKVLKIDQKTESKENLLAKKREIEIKKIQEKHDEWKDSESFDYVIGILDEEIEKSNNNSAIPEGLSSEERGNHSLAMVIAFNRLKEVKKRLTS